MNFFYKINQGTQIYAARTTSISSINDYLFSTSNLSSGDSYYYQNTSSYGRGGYAYPTIISGQTADYPMYQMNQSSYYFNKNATSIYNSYIKNEWTSYAGNSSIIKISDCSVATTIDFCSSTGTLLGMTLSINPVTSNNSIECRLGFDNYAGYCSWTVRCFINNFEPKNTTTLLINFFQINNAIGVGTFLSAPEITGYYNPVGMMLVYQLYNGYSPISAFLTLNNALYSVASGSDADGSEAGGISSSGGVGGDGFYEFPTTDIDVSDDMPSSSPAIAAGLINPYYVTTSEIASLGNFLWSSDFFDNIAKTFSNPMDCIISLSSFPVSSSAMSLGSSESVRVGNTTSSSTGTRLTSEFITIDCGTVSIPEVWGSYLDYAQTKLYIYIPYLGIEELPLCECMGGSVACELRINLLTGALVACVTLTSGTYVTGSARVQPIYFSTTCKSDIPVSGATTGALAGAFQLLGGATSAIAGVATGVAPLAISGLASAAQGVATMQSQNSQISGAVGAAGGQIAHKIPFLIFDRPVQSVPANLASVAGYQSNSGTTLSRCSGYVICDTINLDGLALTRSELEEVEQICTSGVYIS